MNIGKIGKEIRFVITSELTEELIEAISCFVKDEDKDFQGQVEFTDKIIVLITDEISAMDDFCVKCNKFLLDHNIESKTILKMDYSFNVEEKYEDAFEFIDNFFKEPFENGDCICYEVKFFYPDEESLISISIEVKSDKEVWVKTFDIIENSDSILKRHDKSISILYTLIESQGYKRNGE